MARITGSYPDDLNLLIEGAVEAGVFVVELNRIYDD